MKTYNNLLCFTQRKIIEYTVFQKNQLAMFITWHVNLVRKAYSILAILDYKQVIINSNIDLTICYYEVRVLLSNFSRNSLYL